MIRERYKKDVKLIIIKEQEFIRATSKNFNESRLRIEMIEIVIID